MWDGIEVVVERKEISHPMWRRMWQRCGYNPLSIPITPLEDWTGPEIGTHTVICMGERAAWRLVGSDDLFRWRGRRVRKPSPTGYYTVYPTLAPTQMLPGADTEGGSKLALRPTRFQGAWLHDVQRALREMGRYTLDAKHYLEDPSPTQFRAWAEEALRDGVWLSFDIETQYKLSVTSEDEQDEEELKIGAMLRISFAWKPHHAVSVPWSAEYFDTIRLLLSSPINKVGWNAAQFDVPRLRQEGFPVGGRIYDFQDAFHLLSSDEPKGLEWVSSYYSSQLPWKHLNGSEPAKYSCIDADVALINALGIMEDLRYYHQWDLFERHVVDLMPILDEAGQRGNLIDLDYSRALLEELNAEKDVLMAKAQELVPNFLKPTKRYKKLPSDVGDRIFVPVEEMGLVRECTHCHQQGVKAADHFKGGKKNPCKAAGATIVKVSAMVTEWDEILPFNLNSSHQIKSYIRHYKHPMGKDRKTDNDSANSAHLEKLAKKYGESHPIYRVVVDMHKVAKVVSTYIYLDKVDENGYIHTSYVNAPSTWRLASRNVNLQNVPKRAGNKWAKKARRQIIARPGHIFVQADSTSIEAVCTGWLIGDENFIAVAKKSIHAYLCCQELGWEFTDANIEKVKAEQKKLYDQFKTAVYLLLYGGDPYLMYMTNPDVFPSKKDAEIIQDKIFALMPKLKDWQDTTREQAKKEGVLQSSWGYRHKFYDVYTFKKYKKTGEIEYDEKGQPKIKLGNDAKRALAFKPQNCAGAFCRDTCLLIGKSKWRQYMPANISVHDGYTLEVPIALKDEAIDFLVETLTRPIPEMSGIRIGCEVDCGFNWSDKSETNPNGMSVVKKVEV